MKNTRENVRVSTYFHSWTINGFCIIESFYVALEFPLYNLCIHKLIACVNEKIKMSENSKMNAHKHPQCRHYYVFIQNIQQKLLYSTKIVKILQE